MFFVQRKDTWYAPVKPDRLLDHSEGVKMNSNRLQILLAASSPVKNVIAACCNYLPAIGRDLLRPQLDSHILPQTIFRN